MPAFEMFIRVERASVLVVAVLASGCGGGGSGSSANGRSVVATTPRRVVSAYTLSATSVTQTHSVLEVGPVYSEIVVTIPDDSAVPFSSAAGTATQASRASSTTRPRSKLTIYFKVPAGLAPGLTPTPSRSASARTRPATRTDQAPRARSRRRTPSLPATCRPTRSPLRR